MLTTANSSGRVGVGAKHSLLKADNAPDRLRFFVPAICNIAGVRRIQNPHGEEVRLAFGRCLAPATMRSIDSPLGSVFQHKPKGLFMTSLTIKNPQISIINSTAKTTSLAVAEFFEKRHDDVLKKIRSLISQIGNGWCPRNFAETQIERKTPTGGIVKDTIYEITRDGFALLAMGFTGAKALHWKLAYIKAFNAMEATLQGEVSTTTISPTQQHAIQQAVKAKHEASGNYYAAIWSRFNNHFKIARYVQLPATRFDEALSYIATMPEAEAKQLALPAPVAKISGFDEHHLRAIYINTLNMMEDLKIAAVDLEQIPYVPKRFNVEQHLQSLGGKVQAVMLSITPLAKKLLPDGEPKTRPMVQYLFA